MSRARARQFFSSGLGFGLETQKPGLDSDSKPAGLGLESYTFWTRTRDMRTRTRLGLEETRTRCISAKIVWASYYETRRHNPYKMSLK